MKTIAVPDSSAITAVWLMKQVKFQFKLRNLKYYIKKLNQGFRTSLESGINYITSANISTFEDNLNVGMVFYDQSKILRRPLKTYSNYVHLQVNRLDENEINNNCRLIYSLQTVFQRKKVTITTFYDAIAAIKNQDVQDIMRAYYQTFGNLNINLSTSLTQDLPLEKFL